MEDHDWFGDAPDAGWGFTQLVRPPSRQPLGELSGNAQQPTPLGDRHNGGACDEPIVVYDMSDSGSDEDGDVEALPAITQLYDRHEEAPPDDEEEDEDPVHLISEHDVGYAPCAVVGLTARDVASHPPPPCVAPASPRRSTQTRTRVLSPCRWPWKCCRCVRPAFHRSCCFDSVATCLPSWRTTCRLYAPPQ